LPLPLVQAILFEPVGCLAEFAADPFRSLALDVFNSPLPADLTGSQAYWALLDLIDTAGPAAIETHRGLFQAQECRAAGDAIVYEDVGPALSALKSLDLILIVATSLSSEAVHGFLEKTKASEVFDAIWNRDAAGGIKAAPLSTAAAAAALDPESMLYLADTAAGLDAGRRAGVQPILMMNDPDEAMKLTALKPSGGIVSLHELPDFIRLVSAEHAERRPNVASRPARNRS